MSALDELAAWMSESLLHYMMHVSPDPVVALDADDRVIFASSAVDTLGWDGDDMIGLEWSYPIPGKVDARPPNPLSHGTDDPDPDLAWVQVTRGDGSLESVVTAVYRECRTGTGSASLLVLRRDGGILAALDRSPAPIDRRHHQPPPDGRTLSTKIGGTVT